jgi:hypothetical protein
MEQLERMVAALGDGDMKGLVLMRSLIHALVGRQQFAIHGELAHGLGTGILGAGFAGLMISHERHRCGLVLFRKNFFILVHKNMICMPSRHWLWTYSL